MSWLVTAVIVLGVIVPGILVLASALERARAAEQAAASAEWKAKYWQRAYESIAVRYLSR